MLQAFCHNKNISFQTTLNFNKTRLITEVHGRLELTGWLRCVCFLACFRLNLQRLKVLTSVRHAIIAFNKQFNSDFAVLQLNYIIFKIITQFQ